MLIVGWRHALGIEWPSTKINMNDTHILTYVFNYVCGKHISSFIIIDTIISTIIKKCTGKHIPCIPVYTKFFQSSATWGISHIDCTVTSGI